jgi:putative protease
MMKQSSRANPVAIDSSRQQRRGPELLAPAGDWECAKAAVENGADAIYFGLEKFNARMRAKNFTGADLPELMAFLHKRGVRGYVTFNTLIFTPELPEAEEYLRSIIASGVDAAIVQDVGICRLIRRLSPDFPIHGSTQMTVTSAAGVEFVRELGCELVVLARECSLKEITKIREITGGTLPLEVFVHGALCVAYSGQCLTSEALGGRSANRGECAQACRMPYELLSDGASVPLGDRKYLLSPQDLAGIDVLPELIQSGVASLKIEGRLKSPEYVANITAVYRKAIDLALGSDVKTPEKFEHWREESRHDLEMGFSRGLYTGWFRGIHNQELAHARFGKKRGVFLGTVSRVRDGRIWARLEKSLKPGDGVVFDAGRPDEKEEGGRVYAVRENRSGEAEIEFGRDCIQAGRIKTGDRIWKTSDPELDRRLRQTFAGTEPRFQRPITLEIHGAKGLPLTAMARDEAGNVARAESTMPLVVAENRPLMAEKVEEQFGRLGGTPFRLGRLDFRLDPGLMLPVSEMNRLRRELVNQLEARRAEPKRWTLLEPDATRTVFEIDRGTKGIGNELPQLTVLTRNLAQLEAALGCGVQTLYCEFEDPKKYSEAVRTVREASGCADPGHAIFVAPPRITKSGEEWILRQVRASGADGYLVRNYDHLGAFPAARRIGDFSLNIANPLSAEYFRNRFDLERVTASYDLNIAQLEALVTGAPAEWFEVTIHQHMPMFHMEHCVFCAFLSKGKDFTDCGRPCDKHEVRLRDRVGAEHPLKADAGCRNTVYNSRAQTGAEYASRLIELGVRHFRIEFVDETPEVVRATIAKYRRLLRGEISGAELWRDLKLTSQLGVTRGQMEGR